MSPSAMTRRLSTLRFRLPEGCSACRETPRWVVLHDDEPEPPDRCPDCGWLYRRISYLRLVQVERGPL